MTAIKLHIMTRQVLTKQYISVLAKWRWYPTAGKIKNYSTFLTFSSLFNLLFFIVVFIGSAAMLQILSYKQSQAQVKRVCSPSLPWRMSTLPAPVHRCAYRCSDFVTFISKLPDTLKQKTILFKMLMP